MFLFAADMDCIAYTLTVSVVMHFAAGASHPLSLWRCEVLACSSSAACLRGGWRTAFKYLYQIVKSYFKSLFTCLKD